MKVKKIANNHKKLQNLPSHLKNVSFMFFVVYPSYRQTRFYRMMLIDRLLSYMEAEK